jgi:Rho-binding antiterminator
MKNNLPPYRIVSCGFRDVMEAATVLRKSTVLIILNENEIEETIEGLIRDIFTEKGAEYLVMNGGRIIRLDRVMSVDGVAENVC